MKRIVILVLLGMFCLNQTHAQVFRGQYISEWQWDMNKNTNLVNQLRLELSIPIGNGRIHSKQQRSMWQRPTIAL